MTLLKQIRLIAILLCITLPVFATTTQVNLKQTDTPEVWDIKKQDDGYVFLLWPEDPNKLIIHVDETTSEGKKSDYVTVFCNGKNNRLGPNATLTCYGNFEDTISLSVKKIDFHNGATGTYLLTPK